MMNRNKVIKWRYLTSLKNNLIKQMKFLGRNNWVKIASLIIIFIVVCVFIIYEKNPYILASRFNFNNSNSKLIAKIDVPAFVSPVSKKIINHIKTPKVVKGIYMTSWVAGTPSMRKKLVDLIDNTELNSVVIDVKDYTGRVSFKTEDPYLKEIGSSENRIADIVSFIEKLHSKNIYVIGRIAVFQDSYLTKLWPDEALKKKDEDKIWKDYKGISWLNASSKKVWDYTIALSKEAYNIGFDEINFDYIRFPSDGNLNDIFYPLNENKNKTEIMKDFFSYLYESLHNTGMVLSADLFGMAMTENNDLNIGQVLENTAPYFDFIMPMVYPSHYPSNFNGYKNPAKKPYEIVKYSLDRGSLKLIAASSTPAKIRPWLQDFDLGADYTSEMIRAEKKAVYDSGLTSWILWSASNKYTAGALDKE